MNKTLKHLIIFSVLSSIANSTGDAIKFSGSADSYIFADFWWHVIKYIIQIPMWWFTGFYLITFINKFKQKEKYWFDIWHAKKEHFMLLGILILTIFIWQLNYSLCRWLLK